MQSHKTIQRRQFLGGVATTAASASLIGAGLALAADPAASAGRSQTQTQGRTGRLRRSR